MHPAAFRDPFRRTSPQASVVAVIPARYASTRLPGKPLADIGGRPMIEHVYRRAADARGVDAVVVATDDPRVAAAVEAFGGLVRMTRPEHRTGTDRIAEVVRELSCDIVVNVQGDLPLVAPAMIEQAIAPLTNDPTVRLATICHAMHAPAEHVDPNVVKVVVDRRGNALYFSRAPIPYYRLPGPPEGGPYSAAPGPPEGGPYSAVPGPPEGGPYNAMPGPSEGGPYSAMPGPPEGGPYTDVVGAGFSRPFRHIGIYAFRREFLLEFAALPQTPLERAESLEQLRALEHGFPIRVVETEHESIEVDTPEDLERVRRLLASRRAARAGGASVAAGARA